jgi:LEA14-like dessication related protein
MTIRRAAVAAAVAILALGAACAGKQKVAAPPAPKLVFVNHSVASLDMKGAALAFDCALENPLDAPVTLASLRWQVEVEGQPVDEGEAPGLEAPAKASAPFQVAAKVRFSSLAKFALQASRKGEVKFKLTAAGEVATPRGPLPVKLVQEGTFKGPQKPEFAIDGVKVRSMSIRESSLEVRLAIDNVNDFALPTGNLGFEFQLGGKKVAAAAMTPLGELPAHGKAIIVVPVQLRLLDAGTAAFDAVRKGKLDAGVKGTAQFEGVAVPVDAQREVAPER